MKFTPSKIPDVIIVEPDVFEDTRGWFTEFYNKKKYTEGGITANFMQDNFSLSKTKGTLRALHLQNAPFSQAKLVYCTNGAVLDVAVDLRKNSPTYKQWVAIELSLENKKQVFIPRGFAHGFLTLTDNTIFQYKVDNDYNKEAERTVRYNDQDIGVIWGNDNPLLIDRDKNAPLLKDCDINFGE